jgi:hypothetical protein
MGIKSLCWSSAPPRAAGIGESVRLGLRGVLRRLQTNDVSRSQIFRAHPAPPIFFSIARIRDPVGTATKLESSKTSRGSIVYRWTRLA